MHMCIMINDSAVKENIRRAGRTTLYSLMSSAPSTSLHGENGLDPETAIHLMLSVLIYGMEVVTCTEVYGHARKR